MSEPECPRCRSLNADVAVLQRRIAEIERALVRSQAEMQRMERNGAIRGQQ